MKSTKGFFNLEYKLLLAVLFIVVVAGIVVFSNSMPSGFLTKPNLVKEQLAVGTDADDIIHIVTDPSKSGSDITDDFDYDVHLTSRLMAAGDFDGDGKDNWAIVSDADDVVRIGDLSVADFDKHVNLLTAGDFDGDGNDELAVGTDADDIIHIISDPSREGSPIYGVYDFDKHINLLAAGDFDGDGKDEIAVGQDEDDIVWILDAPEVAWAGGYSSRHQAYNFGKHITLLAAGDFDGDKHYELAVGHRDNDGNDGRRIIIISTPEQLDGKSQVFTAHEFGKNSNLIAAGDFDGDGKDEIAVGEDERDIIYIITDPSRTGSDTYQAADFNKHINLLAAGNLRGPSSKPVKSVPDTEKPGVSVTLEPTTPTAGQTITIEATATDNVGVAVLELYLNGRKVSNPFISALGSGTYTYYAKAKDAAGNEAQTEQKSFTIASSTGSGGAGTGGGDTTAPTVSIATYEDYNYGNEKSQFNTGDTVYIRAVASDNVGIASLQIYVDGQPVGTACQYSPCNARMSDQTAGSHTLGAIAADAAGNQGGNTQLGKTFNIVAATTGGGGAVSGTGTGGTTTENKPPVINNFVANPTSGTGNTTVVFKASVADPESDKVTYTLSYDVNNPAAINTGGYNDENTRLGINTYIAPQSGTSTYTARLVAKDSKGATAAKDATITITAPAGNNVAPAGNNAPQTAKTPEPTRTDKLATAEKVFGGQGTKVLEFDKEYSGVKHIYVVGKPGYENCNARIDVDAYNAAGQKVSSFSTDTVAAHSEASASLDAANLNVKKISGAAQGCIGNLDYLKAIIYGDAQQQVTTQQGTKVSLSLYKGWNLVSFPGKFTKGTAVRCENVELEGTTYDSPLIFLFDNEAGQYSELKTFKELKSSKEDIETGTKSAFWAYVPSDCKLSLTLTSKATKKGIDLFEGWNFAPVTSDMLGKSLDDIVPDDCELSDARTFDAKTQEFAIVEFDEVLDAKKHAGLLLQTDSECSLP